MQLAAALALDPLTLGTVVAGGAGLAREIGWVQVVDHPDIDAWVEHGHLLLSTGYHWPRGGEAAATLVERLAAKGACGVVLAVPHFLDHFPPESLQAAERLGLPLIELPWEVPFSGVTQVVHRQLIDRQGQALARSEQLYRTLQEAQLVHALVAALVEGRFEAEPARLQRAAAMGWHADRGFRLALVLLDEPDPLSPEGFAKREALAGHLKAALARLGAPPLIGPSANRVLMLVPEEVDIARLWAELPHGRCALGVSGLHRGVAGMQTAGREVADLVAYLKPGRIHYADEALFPRVMAGDAAARRAFLARLFDGVEADRKAQQLLDTAAALDAEGFHLQRAAARLQVHISTLRYRMVRLSELTGLDLETPEGRFRLQVGMRLYRAADD